MGQVTRIPLLGGAYQSRSVISSAQRCINLYPEINPEEGQAPVPVTTFQTPGLNLLATAPNVGEYRATYRATNGDLYAVVGTQVYYVDPNFAFHLLGSIPFNSTPVSFADNGIVVVIVDGTTLGYCIDITPPSISGLPIPRTWGTISDPNFLGSNFVDYNTTFFIFNKPGTFDLYISLSEVSFALLTQTSIGQGNISNAGTGGTDNTYFGVALTGGHGTGATADITVQGGVVTGVTIDTGGEGYALNDVLSAVSATIGGVTGFTWTVTSPMAPAFDPLDIAAKSGSADAIARVIVVYNTLWPIGLLTTEAWINSGAADFTFQPLPGVFIEHGCVAPFSVAANDRSAFWLSQDRQGQAIVLMIQGYNAIRISTHAIEAIFQGYARLSDAIGFTFQIDGHIFYAITFPTANATWLFDIQTRQWCEWAYTDANGNLNRHRANCACFAYGQNIVGDWQNGNLYALSSTAYTDNGNPISRIRTFPHEIEDGSRVTYCSFIADIQVGTLAGSVTSAPPMISLRWSDDRGATFGNAIEQSLGSEGQYLTSVKWNKLGMARDRVFELSWSAPMNTALQGAFVETIKHRT
jgi:hypothetical protein